jgi:hypothetical protein
MKARGKKLKRPNRKRGVGMSFGELVRKLWQPEPEELEPEVKTENRSYRREKRARSEGLARFTQP